MEIADYTLTVGRLNNVDGDEMEFLGEICVEL